MKIVQQIQGRAQNLRLAFTPNWLIGGIIAGFFLLAILTALLTFTRVKALVAGWDITDLPGLVVNPNADPTAGVGASTGEAPSPRQIVIGPEPQPWDGASRVNVLVMGLDFRDWESGEGAPRTDTMILFSIDPITKTAGMLSIPRDLWVSIPGFEEPDRINVAYRFGEIYQLPGGGPEVAMKTVEGLLGLQIDYFALIEFSAFEQFIDELGGIKIAVDKNIWVDPIDGPSVKLKKKKGEYTLNGSLALAYARARNSEGGDFDRAQRQQQVILAIRDQILQADMLPLLVTRANAIYEQISAGVHTNLTLEQAVQLAWLAQQIPQEDIKRGAIDAGHVNFGQSPDGDQVLKPRPEQIRILRDEIFTASGPVSPVMENAEPVDLMKSENASISILNGAATPGLATRTADYLAAQGATIVSTGDAPEPYTATTIISYKGNPYTLGYLVDLMAISPQRIFNRYDPSSEVDFVIYLGYDWANTNSMP
jgi:LCP family protein required for cell wall assembly